MIVRISMFHAIKDKNNIAIVLSKPEKYMKTPQGFEKDMKSFCGSVSDKDISEWIRKGYQIRDFS